MDAVGARGCDAKHLVDLRAERAQLAVRSLSRVGRADSSPLVEMNCGEIHRCRIASSTFG